MRGDKCMGKLLKWLISVIVIAVVLNAFFKFIGMDDNVRSMAATVLTVLIMSVLRDKL